MKNKNKNRVFRFNRRIRGLTDYSLRLKLLKSKMPRLVVRKSNKGMHVQLVEYSEIGDKIIASARANDLTALGYKLNTGNLVGAYLTGMLAAKRAQLKGFKGECIVDLGLQNAFYGSRIFAAVKGFQDSGLKVRVSEQVFPDEKRLSGEHLKSKDAAKVIEATKKSIEGLKK